MEGKFGAVIVAAGSSRRMGGQGSKVLEDLGGQPVLLYSFRTLASSPWVGELAVVCREEDRPQVEALLAGKTDKPWFLLDGAFLEENDGAIFQDRVKLNVRSVLDENNDNNLWKGRARFSGGFADWRFVSAGGMTGGTELA